MLYMFTHIYVCIYVCTHMYLYRYMHMCMYMCPIGPVFLENPDLNNSLVEKSQYFCRVKGLGQVPDPSCTSSENFRKF